ncbi:hypothetical protein F511_11875 [Dorcoceras hygrometricum]|uniref:Uncharacterized protein n=1 Tax=Dorcoceras hygrometricum TaxID=472368 RepID=A0A2Z7DGU4_9LAMI|nr:hypothetical protein F511_11875 [Dorcoceras hygrometricum]
MRSVVAIHGPGSNPRGTKKTISSSCICPADGSQYYQSAVGLVFMEWAGGLAMETSKVKSAVRNQAEAKLNQLEHDEPAVAIQEARSLEEARAGTMEKLAGALSIDDISSDVIIQQEARVEWISRELQPAVDIWSWRLQNDVA